MKKRLTTIYIVRHGQSHGNVAENSPMPVNASQWGELETSLTDLGKQQAINIAKRLKEIHFDIIFTSDLNRARETAETIAKDRDIKIKTESTIRERRFGKLWLSLPKEKRGEMKKAVELLKEEEKLLHRFSPDGESSQDIINRFTTFMKKIIPLYSGKTICIVNHGNVMRMFLVHIRWAKFNELPSGSIINTGYYVLETNGEWFQVKETYGVNKKAISI